MKYRGDRHINVRRKGKWRIERELRCGRGEGCTVTRWVTYLQVSLEMIVRDNELIQTRHGCHGTHCVSSTLCSRPGGDVAEKTGSFKSCPLASTRSSPRVAPRCRTHFLGRNVSRSLPPSCATKSKAAPNAALLLAQWNSQLCAKNSSCAKCGATAGAMELSKVSARKQTADLVAQSSESRPLVDCKKRP